MKPAQHLQFDLIPLFLVAAAAVATGEGDSGVPGSLPFPPQTSLPTASNPFLLIHLPK
jgi:hypothetical protein